LLLVARIVAARFGASGKWFRVAGLCCLGCWQRPARGQWGGATSAGSGAEQGTCAGSLH
jgi:hypothetical protein